MADMRVILRESDVRGAILQCSVVQDNEVNDLRRWIACRGFTAGKSESKASLVRRIKDLIDSGLSRYVCDPDGDIVSKFVSSVPDVPLPPVHNWTEDLGCLPQSFSHSSLVNYLVHRKIRIVSSRDGSDSEEEEIQVKLPTAQKPLRKGYNFFASGHVDEIKTKCVESVIHVRAMVLSSYKENRYDAKVVLDRATGEVMLASCGCVVGKGGKCNHVAGLLFALIDFQMSLHCAPVCCTSQSQQWHKPARKAKRYTRPIPAGERKLNRHEYGRVVKRKRPLEDFKTYNVLKSSSPVVSCSDIFQLKIDLDVIICQKHDSGLRQILNSSTDTASEKEDVDLDTVPAITLTPEEKVLNSMQVSDEEQKAIEMLTRGQASNIMWHREKKGRISASNAKRCCGKATPSIIKALIMVEKPRKSTVPALLYGVENEGKAAETYLKQMEENGLNYDIRECGLFVDLQHGQLAASPDRLVCDKHGEALGLLEVKCLYSCREMSPEDAVRERQNRSDFPLKFVDGEYRLKDKHQYYYQVQMQMGVCKFAWCDFVVFTSENHRVLTTRVLFDKDFWEATEMTLLKFHEDNVLPALVAQGFC